MLAPLHSAIDKEEHESISSCHYKNTGNSPMIACTPMIDESQGKDKRLITLCFQCCLTRFKQKDNVIKTSAITAVIKSFMNPLSGATTNCHLRGSRDRNGEQR